jgi:hypothetical protein
MRIGVNSLILASIAVVSIFSSAVAQQLPGSDVPCNMTHPNRIAPGETERDDSTHGNAFVAVHGLWPDGVIFKPDGAGFVTPSGGLGMKFGWTKAAGKLVVTGRRLDGDAAPLRFSTKSPNLGAGFEASYLIFGGPGCWEVTAQLAERDDSKLTFVTKVVKIGDGPVHLRSEPE